MRKCKRSLCVLGISLACGVSFVASARANSFAVGDVFVSVGNGKVNEYTPTGTLVQTLDDATGAAYLTGSAFDSSGNFYVTNDSAATISKFNSSGALVNSIWAVSCCSPESIAPASMVPYAGTLFVGEQFQTGTILQYDSSGTLIHTYVVGGTNSSGNGGANWIDFKDADTILYSGGGSNIRSFNITTNTQNPDFFSNTAATNNALRVITGGAFAGDVLVAQNTQAELFSSAGAPLMTYTLPGNAGSDFALTLDPNGTDFWTSDSANGTVWEVNIATGAIDEQWVSTGLHPGLGLSVFGPPSPVPEPGTLSLVGLGLVAVVAKLRKRLS
jgi:PEP-CTERM motif